MRLAVSAPVVHHWQQCMNILPSVCLVREEQSAVRDIVCHELTRVDMVCHAAKYYVRKPEVLKRDGW